MPNNIVWQPYTSYDEKARAILDHNKYMVLATGARNRRAWPTPVFFAYDKDYNLYFLSAIDSLHAKNIIANPEVGVLVFDSTQPIHSSDEVQMVGKAAVVGPAGIKKAIAVYCARLFPNSDVPATTRYNPALYTKPSEMRFFKVKVVAAYTTGPDGKVEVNLRERK